MLDKLVISQKNAGNTRKLRQLIISTSLIVTSFLMFALIQNLFSQTLTMGQEDLNISELIAPPEIPKETPPEVKTDPPKANHLKQTKTIAIVRKNNIPRTDESPTKPPTTISTVPNTNLARPRTHYRLGKGDTKIPNGSGVGDLRRCTRNCDKTFGIDKNRPPTSGENFERSSKKKNDKKPPVIKRKTIPKSLGVVNGIARILVKPKYPPTLHRMGAKGKVIVQVLIDENGKVISAKAIRGNKLLRRLATQAARKSTFTPTMLSNVRIKVRGIIVYNFTK